MNSMVATGAIMGSVLANEFSSAVRRLALPASLRRQDDTCHKTRLVPVLVHEATPRKKKGFHPPIGYLVMVAWEVLRAAAPAVQTEVVVFRLFSALMWAIFGARHSRNLSFSSNSMTTDVFLEHVERFVFHDQVLPACSHIITTFRGPL